MKQLERAPLSLKSDRRASNTKCNALRMAVKEVKSASELDSIVSAAGARLVIVDYSTTWCAPCRAFDPKFKDLSEKYPTTSFYQCIGDVTPEASGLMQREGIKSVPSFHFWQGGKRVKVVEEANAKILEDAVKAMKSSVRDIGSEAELDRAVSAAGSKPVAVYYSTSWCDPCKAIAPFYGALSEKYPSDGFFQCVGNVSPDAAKVMQREGIEAVPAFHVWKHGRKAVVINGTNVAAVEEAMLALRSPVAEVTTEAEHGRVVAYAGDKPVVFSFSTSWCRPCKAVAPAYEGLCAKYPQAAFHETVGDVYPSAAKLMKREGVESVPAFHVWKSGRRVAVTTGADLSALEAAIQAHI